MIHKGQVLIMIPCACMLIYFCTCMYNTYLLIFIAKLYIFYIILFMYIRNMHVCTSLIYNIIIQ